MTTDTPTRIGRYRVLRPLGAGAMGRVLLAHDPDLQRDVAVRLAERTFRFDMLKVDHPWVHEYFHGPRARAAIGSG